MFHIRARLARLLRILHLRQDDEATLYTKWRRRLFSLRERDREIMRAHIGQFVHTPLISVIMPVYNPPHRFLVEAIESVKKQIYPNWELCIADDASTDPEVHNILERYAQTDARIHVVFRGENGHISAASNSALELASGEFVALLDHDDLLTEDALFWVVATLQEHPGALLLYSDEDKIDAKGKFSNPYFKPDWDPYLFLGQNYFCHLCIYKTDLVKTTGGFRQGFEGGQDYDFALRCIDCISEEHIIHIPRILYHWRIHETSTAGNTEAKPYAQNSAIRSIKEHLTRINVPSDVHSNSSVHLYHEIDFHNLQNNQLVTIIIPIKNKAKLIKNCISSIGEKIHDIQYEIVVVDNNSDDEETLEYLEDLKSNGISVLKFDESFNFSKINNFAVRYAKGDVIILLNNDTEIISSNCFKNLVEAALLPNIGAVGAKLLYPDQTVQHAGVILGMGGCAGHLFQRLPENSLNFFGHLCLLRGYSAVTGACLAIEKKKYLEVGGLDEEHFAVAYNDVDFCLKLQEKGYRNLWTPRALLLHHESASRGYEVTPEKQKRFWNEQSLLKKRWPHAFSHDPSYNPNLTLTAADYGLARLPRTVLNAANWPEPFHPSYLPPKATGLQLLVIVDSNSGPHAEALVRRFHALLRHESVSSFTIIGPRKVVRASCGATGWFDVVLLVETPVKNTNFRDNVMLYWPYVALVPKNTDKLLEDYSQDAPPYRALVHACHVLAENETLLNNIRAVSGLDLRGHATCITDPSQPGQAGRIVDVLIQSRLKQPLPACCLGLAR